jgi:threonine synthase
MDYFSTRGMAPAAGFATIILDGLAPDGGLYLPRNVPRFSARQIEALAGADMTALTIEIVQRFAGSTLDGDRVGALLGGCYRRFTQPAITPLVQTGPGRWIMELFHGPTLAFKDVAMQILAPLMGHFLDEQDRRAFIIGATSGDTGGAALAAFADVPGIGGLFLYPDGGVSPYQAAQMLALSGARMRAIPVDGSFDDCQRIVKSLLARPDLRDRHGLTAVNSVNFGRIIAQSIYYARAAMTLGRAGRPVHFVVPTGNFGNVYAGLLAKRMGFAVGELVVANNENDSLHRLVQTGAFEPRAVIGTNTPAMDIQIASNVERVLFDLANHEPSDFVRTIMGDLATRRSVALPPRMHRALQETLQSKRVSRAETLTALRAAYERTGYVADPHTALALAAADRATLPAGEVVVLSTAHPVKFAGTVKEALGTLPPMLDAPSGAIAPAATGPAMQADEATVLGLIDAMTTA